MRVVRYELEYQLLMCGADRAEITSGEFGGYVVDVYVGREQRRIAASGWELYAHPELIFQEAAQAIKEMRAVHAVRERILGAIK